MFQWFSLHYSLVVCFALTLPPEREFTLQTLVFTLTYVFFYPGTNLEPTWNQPGTNLGPTWNQPESTWHQPGTNLGPTWYQPGSTRPNPAPTWHQPGTNLEPTWNHSCAFVLPTQLPGRLCYYPQHLGVCPHTFGPSIGTL
jgi:hypothetical protein